MRIRRTLAAAVATSIAMVGLASAMPSPVSAASGTFTVAELIESVPKAPPLYVGYKGVEQFIPKAVALKKDKNGCILRQQMIIALATVTPKVGKRCKMTGGTWVVNSGGKTVKSPKGLVVTPVVPYKTAWGAGAYAWTPAQRLAWATNVGTKSMLRGKAVSLQSTQTLLTVNTADQTRWDSEYPKVILEDLKKICALDFVRCLNDVLKWAAYVAYFVDSGASACTRLANTMSNLKAWGLTAPSIAWYSVDAARRNCATTYVVNDMTRAMGIVPAAATSDVPADYVAPGTQIFSGYGAPTGSTIEASAFGVLAPVDWSEPKVTAGALRLWDSGVSWRQVEKAKGSYDWAKMDATIARAQAQGQQVMYVLGDTPAWANGGKPGNVPPTSLEDAGAFITAMCQRYQGSIARYQVWNEGNILEFWSGTPEQLADVTAIVAKAVNDCFPAAQVVASSAGARAEGGLALRYRPYLDALKAKGWPVEAFSVHSYPKATGGPLDRVSVLQQWKAMLSVSGAPDLPLYDTEMNYGLAGLGEGRVAIDDATGAAWIAQTYVLSAQYGIDSTYWFLWTGDVPYDKLGVQLYSQSPATIEAYNTVRGWLVGGRMQRCAQQDNVYGCQFTDGSGRNATIVWSVAGAGTIDATGLGTQLCRLVGGFCLSIAPGLKLPVGADPILIRS